MTDQDRGAYTPQTDAPLAFDARYSRGSGERPAPTALILSGVVLLALVAALAFFYRHGIRGGAASQPAQVVGTPLAATKAPPSGQAATPDSSAAAQVLNTEVAPTGEGRITTVPQPESAAPRPVAAAPIEQAQLRPAQAQAPNIVVKVAPSDATPPVAEAAPPKPLKIAKAAEPKPITATPKAAKTPKAVDAEIPTGAPVAQIGAFSSAALAEKGWSDDATIIPGAMSGKSRKVEMATVGDKTFYRAFVGGFASKDAAVAFCAKLKAAGRGCIVR